MRNLFVQNSVVDQNAEIVLSQAYDPYGNVVASAGNGTSVFGYTGEQQDVNGLVYLRARYYNPADGRFQSRDTWAGETRRPLSFNRWAYVEANPILFVDPSGHIAENESYEAKMIVEELQSKYGVTIRKDWGMQVIPIPAPGPDTVYPECGWQNGHWSLGELRMTKSTIALMNAKFKGRFARLLSFDEIISVQKAEFLS